MMKVVVAQALYIGGGRCAVIGGWWWLRPLGGAWQVCAEQHEGARLALVFCFLSIEYLNVVNVGVDAWEPAATTFSHELLTP